MGYLQQHFIKIIIIFFSVILLTVYGSYLLWTTDERKKEFYTSHKAIATHATHTIANEIDHILQQRRILVKSFVEDNEQLMHALAKTPNNIELYNKLYEKLSRYFLDTFSASLASSDGKLLIDDFDGYIGELCINDMKHYVETGEHLTRLHPHPKVYHYDVVIKFSSKQKDYLFLVSFEADSLANLLKIASPESHELILAQKDQSELIEITPQGSRVNISERLDFRMTKQELDRVLSEEKIPGTKWHVYDLHDDKIFETYISKLEISGLWMYATVLFLVVIFDTLLLIQVCKNKKVADDLLQKNHEIEVLNTMLKDRNEELSEQAVKDGLTNLYNRRYFDMQVIQEWNRATRLWLPINIAFIDIDFFKQYNDVYGHQLGDACLKVVADLISSNFKRSNEFVARYGGEEFVVVNIGSKPDFFKICMQEVMSALADRNIVHEGSEVSSHLTMSIGIASVMDANRTTCDVLISLADTALYNAKNEGRNHIVQRQIE